jgi:hypothetical protein
VGEPQAATVALNIGQNTGRVCKCSRYSQDETPVFSNEELNTTGISAVCFYKSENERWGVDIRLSTKEACSPQSDACEYCQSSMEAFMFMVSIWTRFTPIALRVVVDCRGRSCLGASIRQVCIWNAILWQSIERCSFESVERHGSSQTI